MARNFPDGVTAEALARAPHLRFDGRDLLQSRWASEAFGIELRGPTHWIPSAHGFLDLAIAGLAWGMQPVTLAGPHVAAGRLIELPPAIKIEVKLLWTVARLPVASLRHLTEAVRAAALRQLAS